MKLLLDLRCLLELRLPKCASTRNKSNIIIFKKVIVSHKFNIIILSKKKNSSFFNHVLDVKHFDKKKKKKKNNNSGTFLKHKFLTVSSCSTFTSLLKG
ncbi:hypothetical protein RclHR1_05560009 [Rhizophagus clarus]|uniref:Uncharacterized protein n=1 Tax=Rhizophagus clarus TaxID=94130 RepID=A0A2Z6SG11_9GLOM|nr:hypothetical protein RclHR1_05560009 [Rhizophagus clarus]